MGLQTQNSPALDPNCHGLDAQKNDLVFPTDGAALLFGILIFSVAIFGLNQGYFGDPDTYWHIALGKWMYAERTFLRYDTFSYTAFGQSLVNTQWLAQLIFFFIYSLFGWRGIVLLCGVVIGVTFSVMYALLARELRATVALGAAAISFMFASIHFTARPHLLTMPIIVVWTAFLARASQEGRRPSLWLLPLMTLWANIHGGFTIGLLLAAGFGLEATIAASSTERRRVAIEWLSFLAAALLVSCLTPYGYLLILETYHWFGLGEVLQHNGDSRAMNPYIEFNQEVILVCLLAMALIFGVKIGFVRALMIAGFLHLALQHVRGLAIFALVLPLIIAHPLQQQFTFLRPSLDPFPLFGARRFSLRVTSAVLVATIGAAILLGMAYVAVGPNSAPSDLLTPTAALDHAMEAKVSGPVLNDYEFGGYLIFRGIPTFIDGRTLLFGKEFALNYGKAVALGDGGKLDQLVDAYNILWTLLKPGSAAASHFDHSPGWRRLYADDVAVIHVRL